MSSWKQMREAEARAAELKEQEEAKTQSLKEVEKGLEETLTEAQKGFRERAKREEGRAKDVTDANYYFTIWFSNYPQLLEFCDNFGLDSNEMYMDGREVARKFRRALKNQDMDYPRTQAINKEYEIRALKK